MVGNAMNEGAPRAARRRSHRRAAGGRAGPVRGAGVIRRHRRRAWRTSSPAAAGAGPNGRRPGTGWRPAEGDAEGKATERGREGRDEIEWRTDRLADAPWRALAGARYRAQRLAELTGPLLGTAFESGLLPLQSTLGIAAVPAPAPHP